MYLTNNYIYWYPIAYELLQFVLFWTNNLSFLGQTIVNLKRNSIIFQLFFASEDIDVGNEEVVVSTKYIPTPEEKIPIFVQPPSPQHDYAESETVKKLLGWIEKLEKDMKACERQIKNLTRMNWHYKLRLSKYKRGFMPRKLKKQSDKEEFSGSFSELMMEVMLSKWKIKYSKKLPTT